MNATLQVKTRGAWRNVLTFDLQREAAVIEALKMLARVVPDAKWCIVHADGHRKWLCHSPGKECDPSDICAGCLCDYREGG